MMRSRTLRAIEYADLIGIPFEDGGASSAGTNCVGVGRMALERMGATLAPGDLPLSADDLCGALRSLEVDATASAWIEVGRDSGAARRLGDVLVSKAEDGSHVAVLVDETRRLCVTACAPVDREVEVWVDHAGVPVLIEEGDSTDGLAQRTDTVRIREGTTFAMRAAQVRGVIGVYRLKQLAEGSD